MSSAETFVAFGLVMIVVALLAVAIDWFGKPMRHRRFVPKMYRYPDERTPHGASTPTPAAPEPAPYPYPPQRPLDTEVRAQPPGPVLTMETPHAEPEPIVAAEATVLPGPASRPVGGPDDRRRGWKAGDYVFNFTPDGSEPAPSTVRTRYWRNVAASPRATIFGTTNLDRMGTGRAPQRRNPRSGRLESMSLHAVTFEDTKGETPIPSWPDTSVDPFL